MYLKKHCDNCDLLFEEERQEQPTHSEVWHGQCPRCGDHNGTLLAEGDEEVPGTQ